jgi:hypothetical protein
MLEIQKTNSSLDERINEPEFRDLVQEKNAIVDKVKLLGKAQINELLELTTERQFSYFRMEQHDQLTLFVEQIISSLSDIFTERGHELLEKISLIFTELEDGEFSVKQEFYKKQILSLFEIDIKFKEIVVAITKIMSEISDDETDKQFKLFLFELNQKSSSEIINTIAKIESEIIIANNGTDVIKL